MSTPVQHNACNFNLISYILSTYYNLGRKSINTQRHLLNYLEPNNYSNCVNHYMGVGNPSSFTVWTLEQGLGAADARDDMIPYVSRLYVRSILRSLVYSKANNSTRYNVGRY